MPLTLPTRIYYHLKPCLPEGLRLYLRRQWARRIMARIPRHWPINESAAKPPSNWTGWPNGKKFALILTHDVEGQIGLDQCHALMSLEMKLGFRSSFNFVPEGEYTLSDALREKLTANGFEVGVHDLYHNGKLYHSRARFHEAAQRINDYLNAWGATGFRSGFMHHNLDWLHDLDIAYDCSTFDTDPFEPQPDGVNTIFPFWVPAPGSTKNQEPETRNGESHPGSMRGGYWELPYTLPQDYNTFIVMGHANIDLWKQKLDWIATHGGMVLLDTHPDYMDFSNDIPSSEQYPVRFYRELLEYVREKYTGQYWHGTPKELVANLEACSLNNAKLGIKNQEPITNTDAPGSTQQELRYSRSQILAPDSTSPTTNQEPSSPARRSLRVCFVGALFYDSDNRTMRYADTLRQRGDQVDVVALRRPGEITEAAFNGVRVFRIQERERNEKGKLTYLFRLTRFCIKAFFTMARLHWHNRYDVIHAHSIPDFVVFSTFIPKLMGARVILDIYDVTPEFYLSKFKTSTGSLAFKSLVWVEKLSCCFADYVISANHLWHDKLTVRSVSPSRCTPFINYIDTTLFCPHKRTRTDDRLIVIYPGILNWHQGVDIAVRAFRLVKNKLPKAEFHIYGEGNEKDKIRGLIDSLHLQDSVLLKDSVPLKDIPQIMANADLGVVAKRNDVFGGEAYSTKILEYMSQGIPVVIARTNIDQYYFNDSVVRFFEPENHEDMAKQMIAALTDHEASRKLAENALCYVQENSWDIKRKDYLNIIDSLCA